MYKNITDDRESAENVLKILENNKLNIKKLFLE